MPTFFGRGNVKGFEVPVVTVTTPTGGINAFFVEIGDSTTGARITVSGGEQATSVNRVARFAE